MKNKFVFRVIGLMSGTSLDGLDLVLCQFTQKNEQWVFDLIDSTTKEYSSEMLDILSKSTTLSGLELFDLDVKLGKWYGEQIAAFADARQVDFVASHGHTVFHQPEKQLTLQVGNGHQIYAVTDIPVIYDFRSLDVALGGQGAPLVPVGDKYLFGDMDFCLNLGGIANISFDDKMGIRRAFDIAPCNMILNHLANKNGHAFDKNGELASLGQNIDSLLNKWNDLEYYKQTYPKSLGYEWVEKNFYSDLNNSDYSLNDLAHSAADHIVQQIADIIIKNTNTSNSRLLVTGGGTKNTYLVDCLRSRLNGIVDLTIPDEKIIDFKEAIVFAFLGVLKVNKLPNCLSSVTGASRDSSSGLMIGF
jgi:anhydro-N-acetylmuramic acid kinase